MGFLPMLRAGCNACTNRWKGTSSWANASTIPLLVRASKSEKAAFPDRFVRTTTMLAKGPIRSSNSTRLRRAAGTR